MEAVSHVEFVEPLSRDRELGFPGVSDRGADGIRSSESRCAVAAVGCHLLINKARGTHGKAIRQVLGEKPLDVQLAPGVIIGRLVYRIGIEGNLQ